MTADFLVISSYTRAQAIEDGVLIDVTEAAKESRFKVPVAMTAAAYELAVAREEKGEGKRRWINPEERLKDVLHYALGAAVDSAANAQRVEFVVCRNFEGITSFAHPLHMHVGPGDNLEAVITIMLPDED